jgi:hypothetical protein
MAGPYGNLVDRNNNASDPAIRRQQGVFADNPLSTPKYARNRGPRDAEFRDTMARLFISLADSDPTTQTAYLASLPQDAKALAQVLLGNNNHGSSGYVDFILSQAVESFQEVMQVEKTVGDDYVAFFFGQAPPVFQYSGFLLNSLQDDQRIGFAIAYQQILRGTQLARRGALARLRYDSVIVEGMLTAKQQTLNADNEMAVPFAFSFLVKSYTIVQSPLFRRTSAADYVALAADNAVTNLGPVGRPSDVRVRSTMVLPPDLAAVSTAGQEEPGVVDRSQTAPTQLMSRATDAASSAPQSNVRGSIDGTPVAPPAPFAGVP